MEFENQIDIKKLIKTVNNISTLKANTFKSNKFIFNIEMVSILQLIYEENNLLIKRYYLKCSNNIEIVLNEKYEFYRFNIFKENICYSYDNFGKLSYT
ncbi:MAG: hypothetical protein PQJ49_07740, partial [Sphaerochaetaceae bacterium]|nr:hypothetical protein [Sphaerochaetaceae bacterium]